MNDQWGGCRLSLYPPQHRHPGECRTGQLIGPAALADTRFPARHTVETNRLFAPLIFHPHSHRVVDIMVRSASLRVDLAGPLCLPIFMRNPWAADSRSFPQNRPEMLSPTRFRCYGSSRKLGFLRCPVNKRAKETAGSSPPLHQRVSKNSLSYRQRLDSRHALRTQPAGQQKPRLSASSSC
jgi:hypothetical protein